MKIRSRTSSIAWKQAAEKSLTTPCSDNGPQQSSMRQNYAPYRAVTQVNILKFTKIKLDKNNLIYFEGCEDVCTCSKCG